MSLTEHKTSSTELPALRALLYISEDTGTHATRTVYDFVLSKSKSSASSKDLTCIILEPERLNLFRVGAMESHRLRQLIEQLVAEHVP